MLLFAVVDVVVINTLNRYVYVNMFLRYTRREDTHIYNNILNCFFFDNNNNFGNNANIQVILLLDFA